MNRRGFLQGVAVAAGAIPVATSAALPKPGGRRLSCRPEDPGYRAYCITRGDGMLVTVYLDGEKQKFASTADESTGMVVRAVETPKGHIAHDGENVLEETVYGDVRIVIE